jgi:hypothetical protein
MTHQDVRWDDLAERKITIEAVYFKLLVGAAFFACNFEPLRQQVPCVVVEGSSPFSIVLASHPHHWKPSTNVTIVQLPAVCGKTTKVSPPFLV